MSLYPQGHRLKSIRVSKDGTDYLNLNYTDYYPRGLLHTVTDSRDPSGPLSNTLTFTYDHMKRVLSVSGAVSETYHYDPLGNITQLGEKYYEYGDPAHPHQASQITGLPEIGVGLQYDSNGNRNHKESAHTSFPDFSYQYDADDRLDQITKTVPNVGNERVNVTYDYTGTQVAREVLGRYGDAILQRPCGYHERRFHGQVVFSGGMRIASRRVASSSWETASLQGEVWLAKANIEHPAMVLTLSSTAQTGSAAVLLLASMVILFAPRRRRRGFREGHVIGIVLLFVVGTLPLPLLIQPAKADCDPPPSVMSHYHLDHLGSVQAITSQATNSGGTDGDLIEQLRYTPYGTIRGRWDGSGAAMTPSDDHRYEFTGYETEPVLGFMQERDSTIPPRLPFSPTIPQVSSRVPTPTPAGIP